MTLFMGSIVPFAVYLKIGVGERSLYLFLNFLRKSNEASSSLFLSLPPFPWPYLTCFTPRSHKGGDLLNPPFRLSLSSRGQGTAEWVSTPQYTTYTCATLWKTVSRLMRFLPFELVDWRDDSNFHILLFWRGCILFFFYSAIHPVCRKVLKMRIWGIPPAGGPLL